MSKLSINRETRLCMSLSARPSHFGTRFHNYLYEALGLDFVYKAFRTTDIAGAIAGVRALGVRGCAVSMPFKEVCIPMLDALDEAASAIGSVNTIVNDEGVLRATNTDYIAVQRLVDPRTVDPHVPFVLHGSGGMGKAVAYALRGNGFINGTILSRNEAAGRAIASGCGYGWTNRLTGRPGMLVNVTPIGMAGGAESGELAFEESAIEAADIVVDAVAMPSETKLIVAARRLGKRVVTGAQIQTLQAVEQFVLYTGTRPDAAQVAKAASFAASGVVPCA